MRLKVQECSKCGNKRPIVNRKHMLCNECNHSRLHGDERVFGHKNSAKDRETYELVWNMKEHICENCHVPLGEMFEDEDGRLIDPFRYSHILGKDNYPEHRHNPINFNLLCLECHNQWEYGNQEIMLIWEGNQQLISKMMKMNM